ncbi:MAG: carbon-nitrogen hydrolase family protein [Hyphomicrobiales bacterium]|nr:carbon-nitrogen hydrolase family protein [Hyphomicrobiales bacterium]MCP5076324.1 carbon-nitrogen hydrolase family protein [Paracoccaceae bacterium]
MTIITGAVVQAGSVLFDTERSLQKLADLTSDAAATGAKLIVFPEAFIGGYPKGLDFGARLGMRSPEGREMYRRYHDAAIDVPGPDTDRIGEAAASAGVHMVVGVIERDHGTLYCTALFFAPDGSLTTKHRKLMPTALERLVWGFGDGSTLPAPQTDIGTLGAVICWENYMPQLRLAMYAKGVEFYCAPTVDDREVWLPSMQMVALEGRCFVLSACQHMTRADGPADYQPIQGDDPETTLIRGGSCIISPLGEVLAGPDFDTDAILTAEMDKGDIARGKYDLDVTGHYARPDVFTLEVNEAVQKVVK